MMNSLGQRPTEEELKKMIAEADADGETIRHTLCIKRLALSVHKRAWINLNYSKGLMHTRKEYTRRKCETGKIILESIDPLYCTEQE